MDNLTHSLFGWTVARAGLGRGLPHATATLVLASNIPDIDIVSGLRGGVDYLAFHRGPTHGPLGVVGLGLATAALVSVWRRIGSRSARSSGGVELTDFVGWWGLAMIGVTCHILMDLPTSYGTRLLSPFVWTWYALDWMPIIDVYLWLVLIAALVVSSRVGRERAAVIGLALMACDYAGRAILHHTALATGASASAAGVHASCAAAPTLVRHSGATLPTTTETDCIEAAALPTFFSPFTWQIVRRNSSGYELSDRRVFGQSATIQWSRLASDTADIDRVRDTHPGRIYLDFARFPLAQVVARTPSLTTVRLSDARFAAMPSSDHGGPPSTRLSVVVTIDNAAGVEK